jgi:hypothetical protein
MADLLEEIIALREVSFALNFDEGLIFLNDGIGLRLIRVDPEQ